MENFLQRGDTVKLFDEGKTFYGQIVELDRRRADRRLVAVVEWFDGKTTQIYPEKLERVQG